MVRIVVTSSPKSGNHWIRCLLKHVYDLDELPEKPSTRADAFQAWVEAGNFPDGSIFQQHCRFSKDLADVIEAVPAKIVTIIRDPYDVFVSLYYWVQNRVAHEVVERKSRPRDTIIGRSLDDPAVLEYLAEDFGANLARANGWLHSARSVIVRYEGLHKDPVGELRRATDAIQQTERARLEQALGICSAENMRQMNEMMAWHVRSATVGDSRNRLNESHLAIFRKRYADIIRSLGYEVR